jgi:hypothetical protein
MKLYKIIQEQEEETPKKIRKITSGHKRMLNALSRMEIDSDSYSAIWHEVRDVFQINDDDLAQEITYLYHEYDWVFDEDKKISYQDLPDDALSGFDSLTSSYDSSHIALSMHLDSPPFLISYDGWSHFDLLVYEDLTDGTKYAVGDEDEVESSMLEWAQEYFDNEGIEYMDRYYLDDFIELHDIGSFVDEEVESRVSDMDDEEIIEEAGYDKEEMVDNRDSKESEVTELRDDMETLLNEVEELQSELDDMEEEDDEAYETSEYQEIVNQQDELKEQWEEKDSEVDEINDEISDLETEIGELLDTATNEVKENRERDLTDEIEGEGVDWFVNNLGYSLSDAIEYFCSFDESGFIYSIAENQGNEVLAYYDGTEDWEDIDGESYYIYRVE